jgi:hypothetical protein
MYVKGSNMTKIKNEKWERASSSKEVGRIEESWIWDWRVGTKMRKDMFMFFTTQRIKQCHFRTLFKTSTKKANSWIGSRQQPFVAIN